MKGEERLQRALDRATPEMRADCVLSNVVSGFVDHGFAEALKNAKPSDLPGYTDIRTDDDGGFLVPTELVTPLMAALESGCVIYGKPIDLADLFIDVPYFVDAKP